MEESIPIPSEENPDDILVKENRFLDEKDKVEILKINERINILECEMNELAKKIDTLEIEKREPILKKLEEINIIGLEKENIYFKLKAELDSMKPESEEEQNIRLANKLLELEKLKNEVDKIKNEYDSIVVPNAIEKPINFGTTKSKVIMDKYEKDAANRELLKSNKMRLANLLNSKNLTYNNLKENLEKDRNISSPYDIVFKKCKIAYDEYEQLNNDFNNLKKELAEIDRIISKDQFNGNTLYNQTSKLYDIRTGLMNKGIWILMFDKLTRKTIVMEYDSEGRKKIVFDDLGYELHNRNNQFKKLEELELNPPTYIYTVTDILLESEKRSLKSMLGYEQEKYLNFIDTSDPEYNFNYKNLIKKEIIELKKKIKDIDTRINEMPKTEWTDIDHAAVEIEKNKIITEMSDHTREIYLNEKRNEEENRKENLRKNTEKEFNINHHSKNMFEKYLKSIGHIRNDAFLKNKSLQILRDFEL